MKSSILLAVYTLIICTCTAQRAFCPVRSPSGQLIYFTDKPSWSATSMLKTQCTMECSFCSSKQTCGNCRAFNYNSTSQNCSIFNFDPTSYGTDSKGSTAGYRVSRLTPLMTKTHKRLQAIGSVCVCKLVTHTVYYL